MGDPNEGYVIQRSNGEMFKQFEGSGVVDPATWTSDPEKAKNFVTQAEAAWYRQREGIDGMAVTMKAAKEYLAYAAYRSKQAEAQNPSPGYHVRPIAKGTYGKVSKIQEEVAELVDALLQGNKLMALHELSDIVGAVRGFLREKYPTFTMEDLLKMADATERAFKTGERK